MLAVRTYAIAELEKLTQFDRRTIVYYIQQGLLPRAGRRGPNTRYPHECLLRLRFIRALKDLQDQGQCGTITLRDMHRVLTALDAVTLQGLVERGPPAAEVERLLEGPAPAALPAAEVSLPAATATPAATPPRPAGDRRSYGLADAGIRQRFAGPPGAAALRPPAEATPPADTIAHEDTHPRLPALAPVPTAEPVADSRSDLGELLRELEVRPSLAGRRMAPGASEHWTEIPITSRVFLSVRGLSAEDAPLADAAARALKKLLRTR